jgi:hypothetical protein
MSEAEATLYYVNGATIDVLQTPEDAARLLWGRKGGDDAHDMGYAALTVSAGRDGGSSTICVNPSAVIQVCPRRAKGTRPAAPAVRAP